MEPWYATREAVKAALEVSATAYADRMIDRYLGAASRSVEGLLHRRFYPERRTIAVDWPNHSYSPPWTLWLDDNELISVETLTSGGVVIPAEDFTLRRADDKQEPPYSEIQINIGGGSWFRSGTSFQRAVTILGLFGDKDTDTSFADARLGASIDSDDNTIVLNPVDGTYNVGVGSLVLIGSERLILVNRRMSDTGINTAATLDASQADQTLAVTDGTNFGVDEIIMVGAERMRVNEIAGNNLIVTRSFDGSALDDHASGVDIYAQRTFLAQRSALGSSGVGHTVGDSVYAHEYPSMVTELTIAEAIVLLDQSGAAYGRTVGSGANQAESNGAGLDALRMSAYTTNGRWRSGAI